MSEKKRAVGIIIVTDNNVAILQIRGSFNTEKMGPESWPGGCQVTAHGGCNPGESDEEALFREINEELGPEVATALKGLMVDPFMKLIAQKEDDKKIVKTFALRVPTIDFLKRVRLHPSSGGLRLVTSLDLSKIRNLSDFDKNEGVPNRQTIAMFNDEAEALKTALA